VALQRGEKEMQHNYSYKSVLAASERIGWEIDDIIGGDKEARLHQTLYGGILGSSEADFFSHP
jgi:hypothetical protein